MNETAYLDSLTTARIMEGTDEDWVSARMLVSAETVPGLSEQTTLAGYAREHFPAFLRYLRFLTPEDQALVLSSVLLGTPQARAGLLLEMSQTECSARLRMATRLLAWFTLCGGEPTPDRIRSAGGKAGLAPNIVAGIIAYTLFGGFAPAATMVGMTRAELRREISRARKDILDDRGNSIRFTDPEVIAFGAWLFHLVDSHDPTGIARSKIIDRRSRELHRADPECLGSFRISVTDEGFCKMFLARSTFFEGHDADGGISE